MHVPFPLIVCEVISPSTSRIDRNEKLRGYFSLASVRHYLIVDATARVVTHCCRAGDGGIVANIVEEGLLSLDPPGLTLDIQMIFKGLN